jgi:hypothetical protein
VFQVARFYDDETELLVEGKREEERRMLYEVETTTT